MTGPAPQQILSLPLDAGDVTGAYATVRGYLQHVPRPSGDDGWRWPVYVALAEAGMLPGVTVSSGEDDSFPSFPDAARAHADALIAAAVETLEVLSAADIVRYLRATGWAHGRQGSHGAMWTRGDVEFSVPHEDDRPAWLREVVGRLASAEGRTPEATAAAILARRNAQSNSPVSATDDMGRDFPAPHRLARDRTGEDVPAAWITAGLDAVIAHHKRQRDEYWNCPSSGAVAAIITDLTPLVVAAERERAERAEARLAEVRQTIAAFFTHHGNSAAFALQTARDLAEGIRQVLDRAPLEPFSAVCTGPDCGEQFADSETSEYLFSSRELMERLLYADGWQADPVLCPACQPGND